MAGNLVTASPISDLNPIFVAAGVSVTLASQGMPVVRLEELCRIVIQNAYFRS